MNVSPSIASSNPLNLGSEIKFVDKYFDCIHLDIEDGNAVNNISFGMKTCKAICDATSSKEITIHLEVIDPTKYIKDLLTCTADVVFIQTDCLNDPLLTIKLLKSRGLSIGINISNLDLNKKYLNDLLFLSENILVNTAHHDDKTQICDQKMVEFAIGLANKGKRVWIDGGITYEIYLELKDSKIHSAVMGRAIFQDKELTIKRFSN